MELNRQLSNIPQQLLTLLNSPFPQVRGPLPSTVTRSPYQLQVRLSRQRELELVSRYQAGALQRELAEAYGIHRRTVAAIVKRHGALRKSGLDEVGIDEVVRRYRAGESLTVIGKALGVDHGTVRNYLVRRGVERRDTHGRER